MIPLRWKTQPMSWRWGLFLCILTLQVVFSRAEYAQGVGTNVAETVGKSLERMERLELRLLGAESRIRELEAIQRLVPWQQEAVMSEQKGRLRGDVRVAFFASLSSTRQNLKAGEIVTFDDVTLNLMSGYSATTGVYTCPRAGYYLLSLSMLTSSDDSLQAQIVFEDVSLAGILSSKPSLTSMASQGSTTTFIHCNIGQRLWVRVASGTNIYGENNSHLTSFSGHLIWED